MGYEQQRVDNAGLLEPAVVEAGDNRLAGARGHHDKIAPVLVDLPFGRQFIEDFLLESAGTNIQCRQLNRQVYRPASFGSQGLVEPVALPGVVRVVRTRR